ncbi:MAG: PrgI family protein [Acidobacteriaceae bacterium]
MQYPVPQFTEVEDKIIGPLTLKQFLILIGFGAILFMFWSIFGIGAIFYILAIPTVGLCAFTAFKKLNGRPLYFYLPALISFATKPKVMIFKREENIVSISKQETKQVEKQQALTSDQAAGRLKKLAYLLDRKTEEERHLLDTYEEDLEKGFPDTKPPQEILERKTEEKPKDRKSQLMSVIRSTMAHESKTKPALAEAPAVEAEPKTRPTRKTAKKTAVRKPLEGERKQFDPSDILGNYGQ